MGFSPELLLRSAAPLLALSLLCDLHGAVPLGAQEAERPKTSETDRRMPLAPQITAWSPREKAHPGQRLVITGRGLPTEGARVTLTGPAGVVELPIRSATASRIEAEITESAYTGSAGARLSLAVAEGSARVLEEGYRVLRRDALFRGTSFWRESTSANSAIVARGDVSIRLHLFEFQDSGTGSYSESVRLVRLAREWVVECEAGDAADAVADAPRRPPGDARELRGAEWSWRNERIEREIGWRRLPDGRIELRRIGLARHDGSTHDGLARLEGKALNLEYETLTAGPYTRPVTQEPACADHNDAAAGMQGAVPPVRIPFRLVEWSLERLDT